MKKEFPYSSIFASNIRPLVSEERDKYLAMASLVDISRFVPNLDTGTNYDLLPIAFNACVINRVNKNGDVIDTATALANYKNFINKPINLEHNRQHVIGVILTAGFSEFGTDKPLNEAQVIGKKEPFNVTLGGILWKVVSPGICQEVEESNDPTSQKYMGVSASWELGFTDYNIVLLDDGEKNIEAAHVVSDAEEINKLKGRLKSFGGDGSTINDKRVYRMPVGSVLPLGIGLTNNPAADVEGVATKDKKEVVAARTPEQQARFEEDVRKEEARIKGVTALYEAGKITRKELEAEIGPILASHVKNSEKNISQSEKSHVNKTEKIMKITAVSDINDESLKQISASAITDFLNVELKKADTKWQDEKNKLDNELKAAQDARQELLVKQTDLEKKQQELEKSLAEFQQKESDRAKVEKFNSRMAEVDSEYELDEELSKIVAGQIKSLDTDEQFAAWKLDAAAIFKPFNKKSKKDKEKGECDKKHKEEEAAKAAAATEEASKKEQEAKAKKDSEEALAKSKEQKGGLPNSTTGAPSSLIEKYKNAFSMKEGFVINASQFKV